MFESVNDLPPSFRLQKESLKLVGLLTAKDGIVERIGWTQYSGILT